MRGQLIARGRANAQCRPMTSWLLRVSLVLAPVVGGCGNRNAPQGAPILPPRLVGAWCEREIRWPLGDEPTMAAANQWEFDRDGRLRTLDHATGMRVDGHLRVEREFLVSSNFAIGRLRLEWIDDSNLKVYSTFFGEEQVDDPTQLRRGACDAATIQRARVAYERSVEGP
jgi:hypothetical protein